MKTLMEQVRNFCSERDWEQFHGPKDLGIGLVTEAAEFVELFRYQTDEDIKARLEDPEFREKVADELADVFFFLLRFSDLNGFDLRSALEAKLDKNAEKYPVEKAKGSNKKYNEL